MSENEKLEAIRQKYRGLQGDMPPFGDVLFLLDEIQKLHAAKVIVLQEREACARIVEGVPFKERYRQWPEITGVGENGGSQSNQSPITRWCDDLARIIRARGKKDC